MAKPTSYHEIAGEAVGCFDDDDLGTVAGNARQGGREAAPLTAAS
jgi:hypothetical protein